MKETVNGKGSVAEALGNEALAMEKAKSNVLGAWLCAQEAESYNISALFQKEDVLTTFVTNTIRSTRFGAGDPTGIANIIVYNYLLESKATPGFCGHRGAAPLPETHRLIGPRESASRNPCHRRLPSPCGRYPGQSLAGPPPRRQHTCTHWYSPNNLVSLPCK